MRKKLLFVVRGNEIGGGTEYLITLIRLLKDKFDVDIHMTYGKEEIKSNYQQEFDCITFHKITMVREIKPILDFRSLIELFRLMKKEKFDIIHTNSSKAGILGRLAGRLTKSPFIFHTVHGFAFHEQSSKKKIKIFSTIEKVAARWSHYLITVSDFHKDWASELKIAKKERIISIPNGLDLNRINPTIDRDKIRTNLNITSNEIAIFTIGRLAKQKGIDILLNSIKEIKKEPINKKYHFYIAGSGELENKLKDQTVQLGIENKITFLGFRSDVNNLLSAADIVVIPSLWEGLSISLLEAMAAGKAIVTTDIGSNKTVVENKKDAIVVKAKDSNNLKEGIQLLIEDNKFRENISKDAFTTFSNGYTKEIMLKKYVEFYKDKANLSEKR